MEALRIGAMFLVLIIHADFFTFGIPTTESYVENPKFTLGQYFFQALSIGCVNIFVLISGWFGIRPSIKGFLNFVFQCLFWSIGIYIFSLATGIADQSLRGCLWGTARCFLLLDTNWFTLSYMGLYALAPVLNAYVEKASKKQFIGTLAAFFSFQSLYSWITGAAIFFDEGFSTVSFIGLYLLARYVRLHPHQMTKRSYRFDLGVFFSGVIVITAISYFSAMAAVNIHPKFLLLADKMYSYVNPLVILMSLYLLLAFSKTPFSNKWVNRLGASSFAVYLFHFNPYLCTPYYRNIILDWGHQYNGMTFLAAVFVFLVFIFLTAVGIDQIRILIWKQMVKKIQG